MVSFEISKKHNIYENMVVYDRFSNGIPSGWRIEAKNGFVFYDKNSKTTSIDEETGIEKNIVYYKKIRIVPRNYDWEGFSLVSVPIDSVDSENVF